MQSCGPGCERSEFPDIALSAIQGKPMKYPHPEKFRDFFRRLPRWVILLVLVMLFGRFVLTLLFHILSQ